MYYAIESPYTRFKVKGRIDPQVFWYLLWVVCPRHVHTSVVYFSVPNDHNTSIIGIQPQ